jgi:ligand-binding sensor domain-containing protein
MHKFFFHFLLLTSLLFSQSTEEWLVFTPTNSPLKTGFIHDITVDKFNNKWIATDSGLVKTDGINWTTYSNQISNSPGSRFFVVQADREGVIWTQSHVINGGSLGLLRYDGTSWSLFNTENSPLPSNNIKSIIVDSSNNKWILSSGTPPTCYLTKFDGDSIWSNYTAYIYYAYYGDLATVDSNNNIWMTDPNKLTKFDGSNYTFYPGFFGTYPRDIKIDLTGTIWVAGDLAGLGGLVKWKDGISTIYDSIQALSLAIDRHNNVWAGSVSKLYKMNGASYTIFDQSNSPIPNGATIRSLSFDHYENLWMGFNTGPGQLDGGVAVYRPSGVVIPVELISLNIEKIQSSVSISWSTSTETNNKGFEIERIRTNDFNEHRNQLWASIGFVEGRGTTSELQGYLYIDKNLQAGKYSYRIKQIDYDGSYKYFSINESIEIGLPEVFSLQQNYPNPFNPVTTITYQIPIEGLVTLKIYDILGKELTTLLNEEKQAGKYSIEFNASRLSSGVYLYELRSNEYKSTKKLLLMK